MGHTTDIRQALAERERAARELSQTPDEYPAPKVEAPATRQPQDVLMCRWLSAWLVRHWLEQGSRRD